jgi:hypothetical protein
MRRRHAVSLAALPLALLACGTGDEVVVEATPAAIASAGTATLDARTARVEVEVTFALPGRDEPVTVDGGGVVDFEHARSELTIDLSALAGGLAGLGEAMPAMAESYFGQPMRSVQDGAVAYACAEFFTMVLGSECLRVDVGEMAGLGAGAGLASPAGADATSLLRLLGGTEAVEEVGTETLFDVETTHYRGTVTTERALAELPAPAAEELRSALDRLGLDDTALAQGVDVWIDGDGLVRRIRQEAAVPNGQGGSVVSVISFVQFGVDAAVSIPDDAVDAGELVGQFGRLPD